MIGILCSNGKERGHAEILHSLYKNQKDKVEEQVIVFAISNIDFANRRVTGSLISGEKIKRVNEPLPNVIFNLSVQKDKDGIKRLRALPLMKGITLINDINRFDQWMIMSMLSPSRKTRRYMLPYNIYDKQVRDFKPDDEKSYISMPARGSSLSRIIFTKPDPDTDRVIGSQYFKKGHICDYIDASMCQRYWIFIELPEILTANNHPVVIRTYLQRGKDGDWAELGVNIHSGTTPVGKDCLKKVNEASLEIVRQINNYLPCLGYCYIDFIISTDGAPFFLHLSGFSKNFLFQKQRKGFYADFYKNLIEFTGFLNGVHKEG